MSEGQPVELKPTKPLRTVASTSWRDTKIPLLQPERLSAHYGMENRDRLERHTATVSLPLDLTTEAWHREMASALRVFVESMEKQGWTLHTPTGFTYERGRYPAVDLASGVADPSKEEWHWHGSFSFDNPKPVRIPVDPRLVGEMEPTH